MTLRWPGGLRDEIEVIRERGGFGSLNDAILHTLRAGVAAIAEQEAGMGKLEASLTKVEIMAVDTLAALQLIAEVTEADMDDQRKAVAAWVRDAMNPKRKERRNG